MAAKPYDPTLKALVETEPESWPALLGRPAGLTEVIDADIATVSGAADKVLRVAAVPAYLLHLEFVAGHDTAALPRKLHVRNGLLEDRHDLPVRSAVVLLCPEADSPQVTGVYERGFANEEAYLTFRYQAVRVWRLPPEPLLTGGLSLLPLAPISAVTGPELPGIIKRMGQRLSGRRARPRAEVVWAAAYILLGLRYTPELAAQLFRGVVSMKESSTYQAILEEGRAEGKAEGRAEGRAEGKAEGRAEGRAEGKAEGKAEGEFGEAKRILLLQGEAAFGPPDARTALVIERLADLERLEELLQRVPKANSWRDLFGPSGRRGGRR